MQALVDGFCIHCGAVLLNEEGLSSVKASRQMEISFISVCLINIKKLHLMTKKIIPSQKICVSFPYRHFFPYLLFDSMILTDIK